MSNVRGKNLEMLNTVKNPLIIGELMLETSKDVQTEMKKLEEEMNAVLRGMCCTSPPLLLSRDLKAAM